MEESETWQKEKEKLENAKKKKRKKKKKKRNKKKKEKKRKKKKKIENKEVFSFIRSFSCSPTNAISFLFSATP